MKLELRGKVGHVTFSDGVFHTDIHVRQSWAGHDTRDAGGISLVLPAVDGWPLLEAVTEGRANVRITIELDTPAKPDGDPT